MIVKENYIYKDENAEIQTNNLHVKSIKTNFKEIRNCTHNGYLINRIPGLEQLGQK